ncbi:MAG: saccharopine dehydrogenase NADP-binding domain-containing protein [Nitrospirae bacterium]|nr:saccharopine dehydrogenase NADP-binding domain-containing protein [Nitrospirota bacterium]
MADTPRVFVYGATGYTGRLTCNELKRRGIPFTMGGRSLERLEAFRTELRDPSIRLAAAQHTERALTQAFKDHAVVINITGPFSLLGETVVRAALNAGSHYLDTTGEQDFMLLVKERYGKRAAEEKRVIVNANSWYYSLGEAAAHALRERYPHLDRYTVLYAPEGDPTVASSKSLLRVARRPGFSFIDGKLDPNPLSKIEPVMVPGEVRPRPAIVMPGGEALHFASEPGIKIVRTYMASEILPSTLPFMRLWARMSKVFGRALDPIGDKMVEWVRKTPPPETSEKTRYVVLAAGEGDHDRKISVLLGSRPYVVTGLLGGWASERLISGRHKRTGVISTAQAFGAAETIAELKTLDVTHKILD